LVGILHNQGWNRRLPGVNKLKIKENLHLWPSVIHLIGKRFITKTVIFKK